VAGVFVAEYTIQRPHEFDSHRPVGSIFLGFDETQQLAEFEIDVGQKIARIVQKLG
jgi:hypothetical protein